MKKLIYALFIIALLMFSACTAVQQKTYKVKFINEGELIAEEELSGKVVFPNDVEKAGYELDGWYVDDVKWDPEKVLDSDVTLTAKWNIIEYDIEYKLDGGALDNPITKYTILDEVILPTPTNGNLPFTGWIDDQNQIVEKIEMGTTGKMTFIATWGLEIFNIEYQLDGGTLENPVTTYTSDDEFELPIPSKEGYEFAGWINSNGEIVRNVPKGTTGNLVFTAAWESVEYTVKFYDELGNVLSEQKILKGEAALAPDFKPTPGNEFLGWDKEFSEVIGDMDIYPIVEVKNYTIKYYDEDTELTGLVPTTYNVKDSDEIVLPEAPVKQGYEFVGWFEGQIQAVSFLTTDAYDKVFTAVYVEERKDLAFPTAYTFLFKAIKTTQASADPLTYTFQPDFTGLSVTNSAGSWAWSSLDESIATISEFSSIRMVSHGYTIIKAVHKTYSDQIGYAVIKCDGSGISISSLEEANADQKTFKVTFADENGNVIKEQEVEKGYSAELPDAPVKDGYTFVGWDKQHYNITEDVILKPTYKQGVSDFAGKTVSILGDSMSTYNLIIPEGYSCFYPYATADVYDMNQTWWMRVINTLGMKLLMNNSYSGSCVSTGTGSSATTNADRLKELLGGNRRPDIIIIFMGANDCGSKYVELTTFENSYKLMLDMIQEMCPDSEIYLMNLPSCGLYTDSERTKYNNVIKNCATEYELQLLNISTVFTQSTYKSYVVDSVHPNNAGMEKIGNLVVKLLLTSKGIK